MAYGFHSGRQSRSRRQPKYNDDIVDALNHALSAGQARGGRGRHGLPQALQQSMPVNLSNGEYEFTPEEVYAVGLHALASMRHGGRPGFYEGTQKPGGDGSVADAVSQNEKHIIDTANGTRDVIDGVKDVVRGNGVDGVKKLGSGAYTLSGVVAPELHNRLSPYVDAGKAGSEIGTGMRDVANGNTADGLKKMAGGAYDGMKAFAPGVYKKVSPYVDAMKAGMDLAPGMKNIANGNYVEGIGQVMDKGADAVEKILPDLPGKGIFGINPGKAALAGIKGAGQAFEDIGSGYGDHLKNQLDANTPWQSTAVDTMNVLSHVGDALTGGRAGRIGHGIGSLLSGESFSSGYNEQSDRDKFLAQQAKQQASRGHQ